jgi:hypothetical protein
MVSSAISIDAAFFLSVFSSKLRGLFLVARVCDHSYSVDRYWVKAVLEDGSYVAMKADGRNISYKTIARG